MEIIPYDLEFCQELVSNATLLYKSVFIEEYLEARFVHGLEVLK